MNQIAEQLKARTKAFALEIIRFVSDLPRSPAAADESELWLELFAESNLKNVSVPTALMQESRELRAIFAQSNITARRRR